MLQSSSEPSQRWGWCFWRCRRCCQGCFSAPRTPFCDDSLTKLLGRVVCFDRSGILDEENPNLINLQEFSVLVFVEPAAGEATEARGE